MARGGDQVIPRPAGSRLGRPAPWAHLPAEARRPSLAGVRTAMASAPAPSTTESEDSVTRASAVLAALYEVDGEVVVILTRRAQHLRSHRGEVSFPGGGEEPDDADLRATALREAHEEVGLDPALVEVVGELDHLRTITSRSFIVPFVGLLAQRPTLVADPGEVARILEVPLSELLADDVFREERWGVPPMDRPICFFELEDETVWGATATMLRNLLAVVTGTEWRGDGRAGPASGSHG